MEYFTVETLVWALFFAILAAIVYTYFMQKSLSALALKLIEKNSNSEESALTLEQLGYGKGFKAMLTAFFAENGNYISKAIVKIKAEAKPSDNELLFVEKEPIKYYIPDEKADKRLEKHMGDSISLPKLFILIALLVAMALAATSIINMLQNYASKLTELGPDKAIGVTEQDKTLLEEQAEANRAEELAKKEEEELKKIEEQAKKELEEAKAQTENEQSSEIATDDSMITDGSENETISE